MVNSRRKGKVGELACKGYLISLGFHDARRTQQYDGKGLSDVICPESLPDLHIEVKYGYPRKHFSIGSRLWADAVDQAHKDANGLPWVVMWREKSCTIWKATFLIELGLVTVATDATVYNALTGLHGGCYVDSNKKIG